MVVGRIDDYYKRRMIRKMRKVKEVVALAFDPEWDFPIAMMECPNNYDKYAWKELRHRYAQRAEGENWACNDSFSRHIVYIVRKNRATIFGIPVSDIKWHRFRGR